MQLVVSNLRNMKMFPHIALLVITLSATIIQCLHWSVPLPLAIPDADDGECTVNLEDWDTFKIHFAKNYSSQSEDMARLQIFRENLDYIHQHNKQVNNSFELGVTKFADLTHLEYQSRFHGGFDRFDDLPRLQQEANEDSLKFDFSNYLMFTEEIKELPKSKDWRADGAVTRVKDQADCGSCWAFSAVGAIEALNYFHKGELVELSEQNVLDCASNSKFKAKGCAGGTVYSIK